MKLFRILYLFAFLGIASCGKISPKGDIETQSIHLQDFSKLNLEGKFRVFYVKTDSNAVEIETYPNLINNLDIKTENDELKITETRKVNRVDFYNLTIYSKKDLQKISLSDSVEFNGSSEIKTKNFQLNLNQSSKFIGALRSDKATVEMGGHSLANIKGYTTQAMLKLSDTASIVAPFWELNNLDLQGAKGSFAEATILDTLKGNLSNTASMIYYQQPIKKIKVGKQAKLQNKLAP